MNLSYGRLRRLGVICFIFGFGLVTRYGASAQPDYPSATWAPPACVKYYSTGNGKKFCVIHDMEGYYTSSISYLNRCDTKPDGDYTVSASIHYLVNGLQNGAGENDSGDAPAGAITQSVRESNYAWHAVCLNKWSYGTEHEGFVSNPAWYTEAMYVASAALQRHLCTNSSIPMDRNHIVGHGEWQNSGWTAWLAVNFPTIDPSCNSHTDPGIFWDWPHFMTLITGTDFGNYWDMNGDTVGAGAAPNGIWDSTSTNWSGNAFGTNTHGFWGGKIAIFSAGTDASGAYTVTVAGTRTVNGLFAQEGTITFTNGQLNFDGDGSYFTNFVASGHTATFYTVFGGPASPDKWGTGTAVYRGASTSGGFFSLNEGTIAIGNDLAFSTGRLQIGDANGVNTVTLRSMDSNPHTLANRLVFTANNCNIGAGGNLTFTGPIDIGANNSAATALSISNSLTTLSGVITNTGGLTKNGPGTLLLSGAGTNTFGSTNANGATTVNAGVLRLSKNTGVTALNSSLVTVNSGAVLALGASDQISDSANLTLSGGTFQVNGFSETMNTLKLTANSLIDLGPGASLLHFGTNSAISWTSGRFLSVSNWNGSVAGGGLEGVYFGTSADALSGPQIAQIRFINPAGFPPGSWPAKILSSGEIVPASTIPVFVAEPHATNAVVGESVTFQASVTGTPAPVFQWRFNGTNLPGATTTSLLLTNLQLQHSGAYTLVASNIAGSIVSTPAQLEVFNTLAASLAPTGYHLTDGFTFSVTGVPGLQYSIWGSTDLVTWAALFTNSSPFTFTDAPPLLPQRFYRAVLQQ